MFDVISGMPDDLFVGVVGLSRDFFALVGFEEAFHRRVVIAVSFSAHALLKLSLLEPLPEEQCGELDSAIAVQDEPWSWIS